ncbi:hypothetical protein ACGFZP_13120 [Kitasatospora sp. NPDC048239]|uniref:hypothetical protein n=1 Tax=Kitasatospora sp. NPDC048239 TaxID=3364046 RepID=UPI00371BD4E4
MAVREGDSVTVINTDGQNPKTLGRTGTVVQVQTDDVGQLVSVKGIDNRLVEAVLGERTYRPEQLRKN